MTAPDPRLDEIQARVDAVEAAADIIAQGDRGACECRRSIFDKHDVNPPCSTRRQALRVARAALEAAAPYMLATVYEEGWLSARDFYLHSEGPAGGLDENPYRRSE